MNPFDYEPTAPHSVEAEQSVIGALMQSNAALDRIAGEITEQDFYRADHRSIYRQITRLIDANKPADVITVAERLEAAGKLEETGGLAYLASLAQNTPSAANIRRYAEIVRERALLRALQEAGNQVLAAVAAPAGRTAAEIAAEAERALSAFAADRGTGEPRTAADAMGDLLRDLDNPASRHGLKTGIEDFDALTGGLLPGQLHIVAARPSVGKSALAIAIARHVAEQDGKVAFFSLEMSAQELAARLLAADTGITLRDLRTGPSEMQYQQLAAALARWSKRGLTIDDRGGVSLAYVRARCRRLARAGGLSLIVVDYLQLMQPADTRASRTAPAAPSKSEACPVV